MPSSDAFERIVFFDLILIGFLFFYQTASNPLANLQGDMATIAKPFALANIIPQCAFTDIICQIQAGAAAAAYPFFQLVWLILQGLEKISAFIAIILRLFLLTNQDFGIPFLQFFFAGNAIVLITFGISMIRGREP